MGVNSMQHAGRMQHAQSLVGTDPRGVTLKIWRSEMSICFQLQHREITSTSAWRRQKAVGTSIPQQARWAGVAFGGSGVCCDMQLPTLVMYANE
ncbi:hypothetical protein PISMIDRAFT_229943 [Pisolithus microcarpus 441]|uniref:Uncharacterized protein n=1 Tax=Pisolithus microcarpus 441 TaxID=765257 RepID=A0A0C9YTB8_9AGAM|nr:hypothetical protein PISMIDRAFT_229943 [Pisolithus microcarpus 441]